jgi:two-component system, OmpR family, response regulator
MLNNSTIRRCNEDRPTAAIHREADDADLGTIRHGIMLRTVLVVDDEPDLADLTATLLEASGLTVAVAYSACAALAMLKEDPTIDALFSDIVMPGMTGLQLADVVRERYPAVKVVLVSGYVQRETLAGREQPYTVATKPYRIETILNLLLS